MTTTQTTTTAPKTSTSNGKSRKRSAAKRAPLRDRMWSALKSLDDTFVGRSDSLAVIALGMLTRNNFLLIGDPGTAKTALIEKFASHIKNSTFFTTTCGSFTTLDEIVGPPDIKSFQAGTYKRVTDGMLPESNFAFLDEVMKSNDGTINSLLTILNERKFEGRDLPLWSVGSATNWPEIVQRTEKVEALYDRFVLRHHVEAMKGDNHTEMLKASRKVSAFEPTAFFTIAELETARAEVSTVDIPDMVYERVSDVVKRLGKKDVLISDRRSVKALEVMQASAWLDGRTAVSLADFNVLRYIFWVNKEDIAKVDAVIATIDQAIVNTYITRIDQVIRDAASLKNADRKLRVVKLAVVMRDFRKLADEVQGLKGALSKGGTEKLRKAMSQLGASYKELKALAVKEVE